MKKRRKKQKILSKLISGVLCLSLIFAVLPVNLMAAEFTEVDTNDSIVANIENPRVEEDFSMEAGQKVTWDCVWFGNYPQSEITSSDTVYSELQNATGWDANNDIIIDGNRYRRIKQGDATYAASGEDGCYEWSDSATYHYFKYEPIKWRVLNVSDGQALLLADMALDNQRYNLNYTELSWENSSIRSWLNGYASSFNEPNQDYTDKNFIDFAFSDAEQEAINETNIDDDGIKNLQDKIFLLSTSDVYNTDKAKSYGFAKDDYAFDEGRKSKSSTYAKAMGLISETNEENKDNCVWWLRSLYAIAAVGEARVSYVLTNGYMYLQGSNIDNYVVGVRPALQLNLSDTDLYSYAGTVCSDGTDNEVELQHLQDSQEEEKDSKSTFENPRIVRDSSMKSGQKVTWDCVWFGKYPQSEITTSDDMYSQLEEAKEWDENNDIIIEGNRYRRMKQEDTVYGTSIKNDNWGDPSIYHYFKYEPIKWRVLNVSGNQVVLLSDIVLDYQQYNPSDIRFKWNTCTMRSWLNGYDESANEAKKNYTDKNFMDLAFSNLEQSAIEKTKIIGEESGLSVEDGIFLLSMTEVAMKSYGFLGENLAEDEGRKCKSSIYAKAMGGWYGETLEEYEGNSGWFLRSVSTSPYVAACVGWNGYAISHADFLEGDEGNVRPALQLNLSDTDLYSYAGTVCSDGTNNEVAAPDLQEGEIDSKFSQIRKLFKTSLKFIQGLTEWVQDKLD